MTGRCGRCRSWRPIHWHHVTGSGIDGRYLHPRLTFPLCVPCHDGMHAVLRGAGIDGDREGTPLLSYVVDREFFISEYERLTGLTIDVEACRYYDVLYMMRTAVFWISASGLFAEGRSKDLRLARTTYSLPGVLDMAAKAIGF